MAKKVRDVAASLRERLKELGWNESELARRSKIPQSTVNRVLTGQTKSPRIDTLRTLAKALGMGDITAGVRAGSISDQDTSGYALPVFRWVAIEDRAYARSANIREGEVEVYVQSAGLDDAAFGFVVEGDAMVGTMGAPSFPPGCTVLCERLSARNGQLDALAGRCVLVRSGADGRHLFRRLIRDAGRYYLAALNPQYPTLDISDLDITVVGVARQIQINI